MTSELIHFYSPITNRYYNGIHVLCICVSVTFLLRKKFKAIDSAYIFRSFESEILPIPGVFLALFCGHKLQPEICFNSVNSGSRFGVLTRRMWEFRVSGL
jgi:hypothetical protein